MDADSIIRSPITSLVVTLLLAALVGFGGGRMGVSLTYLCLIGVGGVTLFQLSQRDAVQNLPVIPRGLVMILSASVLGLGVYYLGRYVTERHVPV
jgi:hypothetical protein